MPRPLPLTGGACRASFLLRRTLAALALVPVFLPLLVAAEVRWYSPLDGNAIAATGQNGVPSGNPSATADRFGIAGGAVAFDGINDYFNIGSVGTFSAGTITAWVRYDGGSGERGPVAIGASGSGSATYFSFQSDDGGPVRVDLDDGLTRRSITSNSDLTAGQWFHLATTFQADGSLRLYIDGILQSDTRSLAGDNDPYAMTSDGLLGAERPTQRFWDGALDDVSVRDDELSARQVAALHGFGKFHGTGATDPVIAAALALSEPGESVSVSGTVWSYAGSLSGATGSTGGSLVGQDAFIVLDGAAGEGLSVASDAELPSVINAPASNVSPTTADVGGTVTDTGGQTPEVVIFYGRANGGTDAEAWEQSALLGAQPGVFEETLFDLIPGTSYFYRARATNSAGSAWAPSTAMFATVMASPPVVATAPASAIGGVSATVGGEVTEDGGESPEVTIHYGQSDGGSDPGAWANAVAVGTLSGPFSAALGGLSPSTTYFYTASATNSGGTDFASPSRSFTTGQVSEIRLNEFMASNDSTVVPGAVPGTFDDWIEIFNSGVAPIDLGGWHLTDDRDELAKYTFPAGTFVGGGGFLVVFASGASSPDSNGNLHANFRISAEGEYLALVRPDLTVAGAFAPDGSDFPPQETDVSYGLLSSDLTPVYFAVPTPGAPNDTSGTLRVADTKFSANRGFYTAPFAVTITTATPSATIYYTLDSSPPIDATGAPTPTAQLYGEPVAISSTTVLRAAATRPGHDPTNIDTQSYIFPGAVATQTRPPGYPTSWGGESNADYDVDPSVSLSAADAQRFQDGLRAIPTLSISADVAAIFGPAGIYSRTTSRIPSSDGPFMTPNALEPKVSAEYFRPAATGDGTNAEDGFQVDCGLRIQGGASRSTDAAIKHSLSLRFRAAYGTGKLDYDFFGPPAVTTFDSIHLRAMYNNSWIHRDSSQRARATMIRDQWIRDSLIAMGQADGGHGAFAHVYLNGLYWGVYNIHERPENDHYAEYNGGDSDDVIGYNPGSSSHTSREQAELEAMRDVVESGTWEEIEAVIDVNNYIDYFIIEHFGHNDDLKNDGNWRAAGGGPADAPWRFYAWDSERTLENPNNVNNLGKSQDGVELIGFLDDRPEFQVRFADRAYRHLTHGGALTSLQNRARFERYVAMLDQAIVGESARWGDDRGGGDGPSGDYTRADNWLPAIYGRISTAPSDGVLGDWFPASGQSRTDIMMAAWKSQTWPGTSVTKLPAVDPPQFAVGGVTQHGGEIPAGASLTLTGGIGQIYFTTDGSDPRLPGGGVAPGASAYTPGTPISLASSGLVRTRWRTGSNEWSALNEATFFIEALATTGDLRITEINYHPHEPTLAEAAAGAFAADDFEFIEVMNAGAAPINLAGARLTGGVTFTFGNFALAPGARAVVVEDVLAFEARYGTGRPVAGTWTGALSNGGEELNLLTASEAVVHAFSYSDSGAWPGRADGDGSTLEVIDSEGGYADGANWRSSCEFGGTPGSAGAGNDGRAVVNEILTHTDPPLVDAIEIANTSGAPLDISGWFLSDGKANYRKFRLPASTVVPTGGYIVFDESDFNSPVSRTITSYSGTPSASPTAVTSPGHGLATGDSITITGYSGFGAYNNTFQVTVADANTFTIPVPFLDDAGTKGSWTPGQPFRLSSSQGEDVYLVEAGTGGALSKFVDHVEFPAAPNGESLGRWPNVTGRLAPMLTRTLGAPNSGPRIGPVIVSEIHYHPAGLPEEDLEFVEIMNPTASSQDLTGWTLRGDVDFDFASTTLLPAGGTLVVVGFDPGNATARNLFAAAYGIDYPVSYAGPWEAGATLSNAPGGTVRLRRADEPPVDEPTFFPQVIEDEVRYESAAPWPTAAAGAGSSLNRSGTNTFGSFATSWYTAAPSPGQFGDGPVGLDLATWAADTGGSTAPGADTDFDGIPDVIEYALRMNPTLPDVALVPQPVYGTDSITLVFPRDSLRPDVTLGGEVSDDLKSWTPVTDSLVSESGGIEMRAITLPVGDGERFLRLKAE